MTTVAVMGAATLSTIVTAVACTVTTLRHVPPTTDRATGRVVARALVRGTLRPHEPGRDLARRTAGSRAGDVRPALMPLGAVAHLGPHHEGHRRRPARTAWWGLAALLLLGALLDGCSVVQARRALRS